MNSGAEWVFFSVFCFLMAGAGCVLLAWAPWAMR